MEEDKILDLLESANWKDIVFRLTVYATWKARRYSWKSRSHKDLPGGKTPEDIACDAIEKVWQGTRTWDPNKYPDLLTHLKWIVDSDLSHLLSSAEHRISSKRMDTKESSGQDSPHDEPQSAISDSIQLGSKIIDPEEALIQAEEDALEERAKELLYDMVIGDEDLELLLLCIEDGKDKAQVIAAEMGWDIQKTYNLKRKLRRKANKLGKLLQENSKQKGSA